jgi:hypothetical protein
VELVDQFAGLVAESNQGPMDLAGALIEDRIRARLCRSA